MKYLAILFMCIAAAVVYGVVHDQVTARVCVEYFTVGHPRIIAPTPGPTPLRTSPARSADSCCGCGRW